MDIDEAYRLGQEDFVLDLIQLIEDREFRTIQDVLEYLQDKIVEIEEGYLIREHTHGWGWGPIEITRVAYDPKAGYVIKISTKTAPDYVLIRVSSKGWVIEEEHVWPAM